MRAVPSVKARLCTSVTSTGLGIFKSKREVCGQVS